MSATVTYECEECGDEVSESDATLERYPGWVTLAFCPGCIDDRWHGSR